MDIKLVERSVTPNSLGKEEIHISNVKFSVKINTIGGKDGDFWIEVSPSLNVSGYGNTPEEAEKSFEHNLNLFAEDLNKLKLSERIKYLKELGWDSQKLFKRRLSKAFVDENGILQNLEHPKVKYFESVA
ncbi:MAG: hypothetical protein ABJH82_14530 [Polaribacter sp.]|uniref:hypothetical protein n=1 Tax=Polaribacter sp. TaxID=1920175 RepID=UPI0032648272